MPPSRSPGEVSRLGPWWAQAALGVSIMLEGALYAALVPILPLLRRQFDLTDTAAGLLVSGYAAGAVLGTIMSVPVIRWLGARVTAVGGLVTVAATVLLFAVADSSTGAALARVGQGLSAGFVWTACIYWLLSMGPRSRRGELIARGAGFTILGTIGGPLLGTTAGIVGVAPTYIALAIVCLVIAVWLTRLRPPRDLDEPPLGEAASARNLPSRAVGVTAVILVLVAGAVAGLVHTLGPLALEERGLTDLSIGVVFVLTACLSIVIGQLVGRVTDRRGALRPVVVGLLSTAGVLALLASVVVDNGVVYAVGVALSIASLVGFYIPSGTAFTLASQHAAWSLRTVTALTGVAWALGEALGAALAGAGADRFGDPTVYLVAAAVVVAAVPVVRRVSRLAGHTPGFSRPAPSVPTTSAAGPAPPEPRVEDATP